jgi:tRNA (guanine37-N1)-methyltransferase
MTFAATILTLYPDMFPGPLGQSPPGARWGGGYGPSTRVQIRDFATDGHRSVDDTPAGGGAGMVMRADILAAAVDHALERQPQAPLLAMTPRGRRDAGPCAQPRRRPGVSIPVRPLRGIDERLFEARPILPVSIGDYVLSGGETAALVLLDACVRLLPG